MSINRFRPHLYIVPEDDADRQIALGFLLHPKVLSRHIQVVPPAGGWPRVRDAFSVEYLPLLRQNLHTHVVLLIDFDGNFEQRRDVFDGVIPAEVRPRVFVLGPRENPEVLKRSLNIGFEDIGRSLADECHKDVFNLWEHGQLRHNEEAQRNLSNVVKPFLFEV